MNYDKVKTIQRLRESDQKKVEIAKDLLENDKHFLLLTSTQKLRALDSFILNLRVEQLSLELHEIKYLDTNFAVNKRKMAKRELDAIDEESYEILKSVKPRFIRKLRKMATKLYYKSIK